MQRKTLNFIILILFFMQSNISNAMENELENINNEVKFAIFFAEINLDLFKMQRKSKVPYDDLAMNLYIAAKYVSDLNNILIHLNPKTLVEFNVQKLRLQKMTLQTKVETGILHELQNTKAKYQEGLALEARESMKKIDEIVELLGKNIKYLTKFAIESTKKELELK
ncbi:MAG: hypothetical protein WDZ41_05790 [Candidatus Babeliales bacterium]